MHDCRRTKEKLVDLLFEETRDDERASLLAEIEVCEDCREQFISMKETLRVFDRAAESALPSEDYWIGYNERLHTMLSNELQPNHLNLAAATATAASHHEYRLTMLDEEGLTSRLLREVREEARAARLTWPEFKRDPLGFTARTVETYAHMASRFARQPNVALAVTSALAVMIFVVGGVVALERLRDSRGAQVAGAGEELELIEMIDTNIPEEQKKPDPGAAGMAKGDGGGSKPKKEKPGGGGGGGRDELLPANAGKLPLARLEPQILPPNPHPPAITKPNLPVLPTIDADPALFPPDTRNIPYGDPKSKASEISSGTGSGGGIGTGAGGGVGSGEGGGFGPGRGGNTGGGDRNIGGAGPGGGGGGGNIDYNRNFKATEVTNKAVITFKPEPNFTEEARKNSVTGLVKLRLVLGANGSVSNIAVVKGLPDGLTERAVAAARQIRFTPAKKDGRAVSQWITIEYNFNIY